MFEKISDVMSLVNFTDSEGKVITILDGKLTLGQAVIGVAAVVIVLCILKAVKSVVKYALVTAVACICLVHFNIASPQQLADIATKIKDAGVEHYQKFAEASENIKIEGSSIYIKSSDGSWLNVSDVDSLIKSGTSGEFTIMSGGESYTIFDDEVKEMLESLK